MLIFYLHRPKRYKLSELLDWFHRIRIRDPIQYGYKRMDLKYAPLFKIKVSLNELISTAYPIGYLQWDRLERVCFSFTMREHANSNKTRCR